MRRKAQRAHRQQQNAKIDSQQQQPMGKIFVGETTREEMVLGRNDYGMWGETTRVER